MEPMSKLFDKSLDKHMGGGKPTSPAQGDGKDPTLADLKAVASPEEQEMLDRLAEKCGHEKGGDEYGGESDSEDE